MTTLSTIVKGILKSQNISKPELANLLGYKNISKCCRRLDHFLLTGTGQQDFVNNVQCVLKIPFLEYQTAISETIHRHKEQKFEKPYLWILSSYKITSWGMGMAVSPKLRIPVSVDITNLPFIGEMLEVSKLYSIRHRYLLIVRPIPYKSEGFMYHRKFDQTLIFDTEFKLKQVLTPS